jgi:transcriptional regulator of acetoin/glycerol metabolism
VTTSQILERMRKAERLIRALNMRAEECRVVLEDLPPPERYEHPQAREAAQIAREAVTAAAQAHEYNAAAIARLSEFLLLSRPALLLLGRPDAT